MSKRRFLLGALLLYLGSWGATFVLSGPAVERTLMRHYGVDIQLVDHIGGTHMSMAIDTTVPAPFLVRAETDYSGLVMCGEGADWTLIALPGKAWILHKHVRWLS